VFAIDKKERMMALAVVAAVLAGILGWTFLHHLENTFQEGSETISVLVANRYMVAGTALRPAFFTSVLMPKAYVQPAAVTDFSVLESSPGHPRFRNSIPLMEGSQLVQPSITLLYSQEGLSQLIPEGDVAVSFGVDNVRGMSGNIRPGDLVNILHTPKTAPTAIAHPPTTNTLFQAVHVVAVGKKLTITTEASAVAELEKSVKEPVPEETAESITVITVALNPLAAVRLSEARENEILSVVLRPQGDDRIVEGLQ
jgi:Flp pilus assembly protein CpaB